MKKSMLLLVFGIAVMLVAASCGPPEGYDLVKQNAITAKNEAQAAQADQYCATEWMAAEQVMNQAMAADEAEEWETAMPLFQQAINLYNQAKMCAIKKQEVVVEPPKPEPPKPAELKIKAQPWAAFFDYDRFNIRTDQVATLQDNAAKMKDQFKAKKFMLTGFCDSRGTDEYNLALGERRAASVYNFLVATGVDAANLMKKSGGETTQFGAGENEADFQANRRVQVEDITD